MESVSVFIREKWYYVGKATIWIMRNPLYKFTKKLIRRLKHERI